MTLLDKRAIKITELTEQLEEANQIIAEFVWPSDSTDGDRQRFKERAAKFSGCTVPIFDEELCEACES